MKPAPQNRRKAAAVSAASAAAPADGKIAVVRSQLVRQLREAIIDGHYLPGDRLVERDLCEQWSVSRPSLREALRQLEAEGLIEIVPHRGPSVRRLTQAEMLELKELEATLECMVARRFASHGTAGDIEALAHCIDQLERALAGRNRQAIKRAKNAWYEAFTAGAHSSTLQEYVRQINARLAFLWASSLMVPGRATEYITDLRMLLEMLRKHNADGAEAAIVINQDRATIASDRGWALFEAGQTKEPPP